MNGNFFIYLAVMALTTYLVRAVPFVAFTKSIKNRFFKSFLQYVPYAVLSAMTIPAILYATKSIWSGAAGLLTAVLLSLKGKSLIVVAFFSCLAVFIAELFLV